MLILEARNIKKYYGERLIVELESFKLYSSDRIGVVGLNGCGKTTLLNILTKQIEPDEGSVKLHTEYSLIKQLEEDMNLYEMVDDRKDNIIYKEFNIKDIDLAHASGGEKTRLKIASGLSSENSVLFADEPTCNLDIKGARLLEEKLELFKGALVIISHDRTLMDNLCNKIMEIENGKVSMYEGNYTDYRRQKEAERERQHFEYEEYIKEKRKLENTVKGLKSKVKAMRKAPARMGNSEARLHTRKVNGKKAKIDRAVKSMETRVSQLEVKEKLREMPKARIDIQEGNMPVSKVAISIRSVTKSFGARKLFENVSFEIPNGSKVALVGDNGSGKTTLLNMILNGDEGIKVANGANIGYFSQNQDILDNDKTILENVLKVSVFPESFVRTILARLLFLREDVHKKVGRLSGGERVKAAFARVFVQDVNLIIMDEPTNYLDIYSMEALEGVLGEYEGTVLFVSHDRRFIEKIADFVLLLDGYTIRKVDSGFDNILETGNNKKNPGKYEGNTGKLELEKMILLENRLAEINGRLCMPSKKDDVEALNIEYMEAVRELKHLKERIKAVR